MRVVWVWVWLVVWLFGCIEDACMNGWESGMMIVAFERWTASHIGVCGWHSPALALPCLVLAFA